MKNSLKISSFIGASILAVSLTVTGVSADKTDLSCICNDKVEFNNALPQSHPVNRCASLHQPEVSWSSWLFGGGHSRQFHYLDLLELLSRSSSELPERAAGRS
ncbi:hypothetical protein [Neptunicella marina]|uniref:Uncharacterized protein n=1 Tax=Neptunicella marina TaxID=2125989 RepID=A0A8J6IWW9_9ALTE|nr:hypothetical protein [Neptunicella marina]MBC3767609.1 hypothetical protein [Neptunicella marina]